VEKYGGAFMYGTYPPNAGEEFKSELFAALEKMISDSVAVLQEGSQITIESMSDKRGSSDTYTEFIKMANAEISKAVLGETLTTEIGDKGSYAAAQTHNEVREELAMADRRRISAAFNRLAAVYTFYNFGEGVEPPLFTFVKDEDLQVERAKRDVDLHTIGWYPRKAYIAREYGIPEEDFDLAEKPKEGSKEFGRRGQQAGCGCREGRGFFGALTSLFSSKGERAAGKDGRLMEEFGEGMLEAGQEEIDRAIEAYAAAMGKATNFDDAAQELMAEYLRRNPGRLASLANEIRYAASGIGGRRG
jgi:phage gp29-like protein